MKKSLPIRPNAHNLEDLSRRYFEELLPRDWAADKPGNDYGIDLRVDIFENNLATGLEFLVQLKSSDKPTKGDFETITLRTATYNMLWDKLQVAMLVKYVESKREAYWMLLKDVPEPNQKHKSFTVYIPRENKLSTISWDELLHYVRDVTDEKLAHRRARQLNRKRSLA